MKGCCVIGLLALALASCKFGKPGTPGAPDIFTDTVAYTMQTIHQRASDCGNLPDSACTVASIRYPLFKGQEVLNDTVKSKLLNIFGQGDEKADTSLTGLTARYMKQYLQFKKNDERKDIFFELDIYAKVVSQDSCLLTLEYGGYTFQGGAHGSSFTGFINWDPKTKKAVYLKDILLPGTYAQLSKVAERVFRKNEKLKDTSSLELDYFFEDSKFTLNQNYLFTPTGIRFLYNEYEIKSYAAGQTELDIPWVQIKTLIKPHSVVAQYIKKDAGI